MDPKIKELAKRAGFLMWEDREWNLWEPCIDWSCFYYDEQLIKFYELAREQFLNELKEETKK